MENKVKHLEMIQNSIIRLENNSFSLKGWAATLFVGIIVLSNKDADKMYFFAIYIPILIFWFFDAYYLSQKRLFFELYEKTKTLKEEEINFDMNILLPEFKNNNNRYFKCIIYKTEVFFYFPLALLSCVIIIIS